MFLGGERLFLLCIFTAAEPERFLAHSAGNDLLQPHERSAADEQNVRRIYRSELLVWTLASSLWRNIRDRTFQNLQERLLDALARNIAGNRGILVLAPDLVHFVDVDNASLGSADVPIGGLQQLQDNVFDVLADVARLGQGSCINNRKGDVRMRASVCAKSVLPVPVGPISMMFDLESSIPSPVFCRFMKMRL